MSGHPSAPVDPELVPATLATNGLRPPFDVWAVPADEGQVEDARRYLQVARDLARQGAEWPSAGDSLPEARGGEGSGVLCVIGAGTMGAGIAQAGLQGGCQVVLVDRSADALKQARARIERSLQSAVARGRLDAQRAQDLLQRLEVTDAMAAVSRADIVIEAIYESMTLKCELMRELGRQCPPRTLLISNTSTLDIDALGQASGRPAQVLGVHFLTPAHVTPLVEVVQGRATDAASVARARALVERMGKLPVLTGNAWGFIGNRMYECYLREVDALQLEGVPAHRIDAALEDFGFAMGPCRQIDMAGTDLVAQVLAERSKVFPVGPAYRRVTRALAELGRWGVKSGRGHYLYHGADYEPDPELATLCQQEALGLGIAQRPGQTAAEIVRRCLDPLMDEGRAILREGLAHRASDIDLVWVMGYGFPASRGGPMRMRGLARETP